MRPRRGGGGAVILAPLVWLVAFVLAPVAIVAKISLSESALAQPPYRPVFAWTTDLDAWRAVLGGLRLDAFATLLGDPLYLRAGLASLAMAAVATGLLALLGYPLALALARAPRRSRPILVALVLVPFWTSLLIRTYAWIAILKPDGLLNAALLHLGLVARPLAILDTDAAVLIGLVYAYLPFMVLPLYAVLVDRDDDLLDAARDLGASPLGAFWTVTAPLSLPGLAAGALLCFIPITGEFVIPDLLGGAGTPMLGRVVWSEFFANRDWPVAAALSLVATLVLIGPILLVRAVADRRPGRVA